MADTPFRLGAATFNPDGTLNLTPGVTPGAFGFDSLTGGRVTRYRFDLLDKAENLLKAMKSVTPGGGVEWQAYASVKGGGTMTVRDTGQTIDWLNSRIRPTAIISSPGGVAERDVPLGVFLPAAPVEQWDEHGRSWAVELADKLSILDTDIPNGPAGTPVSFTAPIGSNVITLVQALINETGESSAAIQTDPAAVLTSPLVWDLGTTRLQIINDLLEVVRYASLWCDGQGQYQALPLVEPKDRTPVYESIAPFSKGDTSVMSSDWTRDRNIYEVPNRYVAVSQGDGEDEGMTSTVTNTDPTSPFSFQARGRWITRTVTGVEVATQAGLDSRARMGLAQSTSISSGITASNLYLPDLLVNSVVRFTNPDAGVDFPTIVTRVFVPFDPLALSTCDLREVLT